MISSGVYKILNKVNNKFYIGSAVNLNKRKSEHFNYPLKSSKILQRSISKYGKENFEFIILENCDKDKCLEREQYYLDLYKSYDLNIGYNISNKANQPSPPTKEQLQKGVETKRRKGWNKIIYPSLGGRIGTENKSFGRKGKDSFVGKEIYCFDIKGNFIKKFDTLTLASEEFKCDVSAVSANCRGTIKSLRNHIFSFTENVKEYKDTRYKKVEVYDLNFNLIYIFKGFKEAARKLNISQHRLHKANKNNTIVNNYYIKY